MSRGTVEIPIEVWEGCERDAERIAFLHKQVAALSAENERLRKAGDAMADWFWPTAGGGKPVSVVRAWNAAKGEGAK